MVGASLPSVLLQTPFIFGEVVEYDIEFDARTLADVPHSIHDGLVAAGVEPVAKLEEYCLHVVQTGGRTQLRQDRRNTLELFSAIEEI